MSKESKLKFYHPDAFTRRSRNIQPTDTFQESMEKHINQNVKGKTINTIKNDTLDSTLLDSIQLYQKIGGGCTDVTQCRVKYDDSTLTDNDSNSTQRPSAYFSCGGNMCFDQTVGNIDTMNQIIMPESSRSTGYLQSEYVNDLFLDMKDTTFLSNRNINQNILEFPRGGESTRRINRIK